MKTKFLKSKTYYVLIALAWIFNFYMWHYNYVIWRDSHPVTPEVVFSVPLSAPNSSYDYCRVTDNSSNSDKAKAGTPVASVPVIMNTPEPTQSVAMTTPSFQITGIIGPDGNVIPVPTATQTAMPTMEPVKEGNWHIMVVGDGFSSDSDKAKMTEMVNKLTEAFKGVNVDFRYAVNPIDVHFYHIDTAVDTNNKVWEIFAALKARYPIDGLLIGVNTNDYIGTEFGRMMSFAVFSANDPNSDHIAIHETGHILGLDDGYQAYYDPKELPNSELFYRDAMPYRLQAALKELGTVPPLYQVGNCNGRALYKFYETQNNIYGDYAPVGPNSWGNSVFTPLQIQIMNDFVRDH